jgi:nicotinamidase-related amidase
MDLNPQKTALLTLDFQKGILESVKGSEVILPQAAKAIEWARKKGFHIIHVGLGFLEGHPEIPDLEMPFLRIKKNNLFVKGTASSEIHSSLILPKDLVVYKKRVGAFCGNELQLILRAKNIENLILLGISTSGIVLSTLRHAFDLDYRSIVLKDACFDPDEEVHRVLCEKIFPKQARVMTVNDFIVSKEPSL